MQETHWCRRQGSGREHPSRPTSWTGHDITFSKNRIRNRGTPTSHTFFFLKTRNGGTYNKRENPNKSTLMRRDSLSILKACSYIFTKYVPPEVTLLEIPPCQTPMCGVAYSCSCVLLTPRRSQGKFWSIDRHGCWKNCQARAAGRIPAHWRCRELTENYLFSLLHYFSV